MKELKKYLRESVFNSCTNESIFDSNFGVDDEKVMPLVSMFRDAECTYNGDMAWRFRTTQNGDFNWMLEWMNSSVAKHYGIKQLAKKSMLGFNVFSNGSWFPGIELKNFYCFTVKSDRNGAEFTLFYPVRVTDNTLYYIEIYSDQFRYQSPNKADISVFMKSQRIVEEGRATEETTLYKIPKKYFKEIIKTLKITQLNKYS